MIEKLENMVDDTASLNSKLILLISSQASPKSKLISELSRRRDTPVLKVGNTLGKKLLQMPSKNRHLMAADIMKNVADEASYNGLLLIDHTELLFDRTLELDPLALLKKLAHKYRVVAIWPGELNGNHLYYADVHHSEYRKYSINGVIPFIVE